MAIPEIDLKKTANKVKDFFSYDFPGICRRAGQNPSGLKAVIMDGMPKQSSYANNVEESVFAYIDRQVEYEQIVNTIKSLDITSQNIIIYDVIEHHRAEWCYQRLHMMHTRYSDYKRYALNAFADAYEYRTAGENDLHSYIGEKIKTEKVRKKSGKNAEFFE
jgi:ArpU family phage transcriptional regulator